MLLRWRRPYESPENRDEYRQAIARSYTLVLDSIERERWYTVVEVAQIVVWSGDVERGWIQRGLIEAFIREPGIAGGVSIAPFVSKDARSPVL
jgi:hypothetical protein